MLPVAKVAFVALPVFSFLSSVLNQFPATKEQFQWKLGSWGECSQCNGSKSRKVVCFDLKSESFVLDQFCEVHQAKPENLTNCGCPEWVYGKWGECSIHCNRKRLVACRGDHGEISDECAPATKPHEIETCCKFSWENHGNLWEKCKHGSVYVRKSICKRFFPEGTKLRDSNENGIKVDDGFCGHIINPQRKLFCVNE